MADDTIKIAILAIWRRVGAATVIGLPDATGPVNENLVEAAIVRLIGFFIAEMPLAKNAGRVS